MLLRRGLGNSWTGLSTHHDNFADLSEEHSANSSCHKSSLRGSEKEKKQVNSGKKEAIFKLNEHWTFLTAYGAMHTGAWCTLSTKQSSPACLKHHKACIKLVRSDYIKKYALKRRNLETEPTQMINKDHVPTMVQWPRLRSWLTYRCQNLHLWYQDEINVSGRSTKPSSQVTWPKKATGQEGSSNHNDGSLQSPVELYTKRKKGGWQDH